MVRGFLGLILAIGTSASLHAVTVEADRAEHFRKIVKPLLTNYCFDCHADGAKKGNVQLDQFTTDAELLNDRELWFHVLKYVQSDVMPPSNKPHPDAAQKQAILNWIKTDVFLIDPAHPNPGRVTVHRLNRAEYRNSIRDLMGVDFDTAGEFPPDDTGFGFDNISDVLTLSPMLLEKYLGIAKAMTAILSSPRFLYREEQTLPAEANQSPLIDECSLASRLSYFLWSSMPDDELLKLAGKNELRKNLQAQVKRMLQDATSITC
jgi:Protein of unknown function (DUF1587)/Protein of unknown function (DUF1592)/Planctomycete cytochrome C